jgi:hypothetical protein
MAITKQRMLDYMEFEWGTYVERFNRLPIDEQTKRVKEQGYESLRDMLAHILAWWEEGMGILRAIAEERPFERKKYDFDVFNAEAISRYGSWDVAEFMAHFENTRQKMETDLRSMNEAVFENRRVKAWIRAVITHHAREHSVTISRFLVMDMLENEWSTYVEDLNRLDDEKKHEFLSAQGFESYHDLLAHIVGWWEEGSRVIRGILDSPSFAWETQDVDAFNAELTKKYSSWSDEDLFKHYETVRLALLELTAELPDDAFLNEHIEGWLKDDVVTHYDEHVVPA